MEIFLQLVMSGSGELGSSNSNEGRGSPQRHGAMLPQQAGSSAAVSLRPQLGSLGPLQPTLAPSMPSSQSLTAHYIPERLPSSPSRWGKVARKQHSKWARSTSPMPDAGEGTHPSTSSPPPGYRSEGRGSPAVGEDDVHGASTGLLLSPLGDPGRVIHGLVKRGAGRDAWGSDGAGNRGLGAGDFEDDDGVDLDGVPNHGQGDRIGLAGASPALTTSQMDSPYATIETKTNSENYLSSDSHQHRRLIDTSSHRSGLSLSNTVDHARKPTLRTKLRRIVGLPAEGGKGVSRLRWNRFKWLLVGSNLLVRLFPCIHLMTFRSLLSRAVPSSHCTAWAAWWGRCSPGPLRLSMQTSSPLSIAPSWPVSNGDARTVQTYFRADHALLSVQVGTAAMILCLATSIVGWAGILLNNRAFLTVYSTLLWPAFALMVAPGYITYKKRAFNLDGKMNNLWSRMLSVDERRQIQLAFGCCGYYSPFVEASADSLRCFARSMLPGCKGPFMKFESMALINFYATSFGLVPVHLFCIVVALLCSDHVTYRFGKGITPKAYRLDEDAIADMKGVSLAALRLRRPPLSTFGLTF